MEACHENTMAGHLAHLKNFIRIRSRYISNGIYRTIFSSLATCLQCQRLNFLQYCLPESRTTCSSTQAISSSKNRASWSFSRIDLREKWIIVDIVYLIRFVKIQALAAGAPCKFADFLMQKHHTTARFPTRLAQRSRVLFSICPTEETH